MARSLLPEGTFVMLEPYAGKLACTVMESSPLPDLCGAYGYGESDAWCHMLGARCQDTG